MVQVATLSRVHCGLVALAFATVLVVGCLLHYQKIVTNADYTYPDEWFPSVSATIGDWYPERNLFQMLLAVASGPRITLILVNYTVFSSTIYLAVALARTVTAGGWIYVTSTDSHNWHDHAMLGYLLLSGVYYGLSIHQARVGSQSPRPLRRLVMAFAVNLVPLVWHYYRHKVLRLPGAYSWYAIFEWVVVVIDVTFDYYAGMLAGPDLKVGILPQTPIKQV
ncbi:hypothetical protein DIURU_000111 [Diutina rugosa]|uniref:CWH43-like N-terminal domain-containing protein n=1 Tax=Diutina rugosa TaxID=5481 RepID=A0A642UZ18_DIURU|nr:uncharacterized protein DIURU_000111 [Diutina rugosa]KAA8908568.1 hypothetical protein DIURU_000111 [Diutina rugosa]